MESSQIKSHYKTKPHHCIWMKSGVVHRKLCKNDFHCSACRFDIAMRRVADENRKLTMQGTLPKGSRGKIVFWKQRLKELPTWKQPCLHHLKGRIDFRTCTNEYKCSDCEFDQYFQDQFIVHTVVKKVDILDIKGFKVPQGYYIHKGHTWAKIEEDASVRVGIDDFALRLLGPLDHIDSPLMGKTVKQNNPDISLGRGPNKAKLLSPVSGVITAINPKLREKGSIANENPYTEGWFMQVHCNDLRKDLKHLMIGDETQQFVDNEVDHLFQAIEENIGPISADGGNLVRDIYGTMPELGWDRLTNLFLRT